MFETVGIWLTVSLVLVVLVQVWRLARAQPELRVLPLPHGALEYFDHTSKKPRRETLLSAYSLKTCNSLLYVMFC